MQIHRNNSMARRPDILAANACFLLGGAGLVVLNEVSGFIIAALYAIFGEISQPSALFWVDALYYLPFIVIPCILLGRKYGTTVFSLEDVPRGHAWMSILTALVCIPVVNSLTIVWTVLLECMGFTLQDTTVVMENTGDLAMAVIAMAALPGICEELLFRGVIMGSYRSLGARKALIVSSLMFATLHGSVQGFPAQFLMGLVLGHVVMSGGSIYAGMMLHTAYNALLIMITYIQQHYLDEALTAGTTVLETVGIVGVISVMIEGSMLAGLLFLTMRFFSRRSVARMKLNASNAPEMADDLLKKADGAPEKADITSEKADITPEKEDIAPEKADITPEKADGVPEKAGNTPEDVSGMSDERSDMPKKTGNTPVMTENNTGFPVNSVKTVKRPPVGVGRYGIAEWLVLISGIVTVAYLYLTDFMYMLGYL